MSKTIFEQQNIDYTTGEITSLSRLVATKHDETFGMHRTTEGIDWVFQFTGNELQFMIVLLNIESLQTGVVSMTQLQKQHLIEMFKFSPQYYRRIVHSLEEKGALKKLTSSDWLLNPQYFYKGGTKEWKAKWDRFKNS